MTETTRRDIVALFFTHPTNMNYLRLSIIWLPICLAVVLLGAGSPCFADAGTGLMILSGTQKWVGNLFIGIGESFLLTRIFKIQFRQAMLMLIPANYCSFLIGHSLLQDIDNTFATSFLGSLGLQRILAWNWILFGCSYLITVITEAPFIWLALGARHNRLRATIKASLILQTASYAVLVPIYCLALQTNLITETHLEPTPGFAKQKDALVLYVSENDDCIWQRNLDGTSLKRVSGPIPNAESIYSMGLKPQKNLCRWDGTEWVKQLDVAQDEVPLDLITFRSGTDRTVKLITNIYGLKVGDLAQSEIHPSEEFSLWGFDLRKLSNRGVQASTMPAFVYGLRVLQAPTIDKVFGLETPFTAYIPCNLTVLPRDQAVFELRSTNVDHDGSLPSPRTSMVLLFDLHTYQLAVLDYGKAPVVILRKP